MTKAVLKLVAVALFFVCAGGAVAHNQVATFIAHCCGGPPPLCPGSPGCPGVAVAKK